MNQGTWKAGLITLNLLLVVLLCFYLEIPTRIIGSFSVTTDDKVFLDELRVGIQQPQKNQLPQDVTDRIKTFVFFLGHARSGHSIVGSLMDSHPHMVISHEADLFTKLSKGAIAPTKSAIFNTVWSNTKLSIKHGRNRAKTTDGKGYTLFVDGLYQGSS